MDCAESLWKTSFLINVVESIWQQFKTKIDIQLILVATSVLPAAQPRYPWPTHNFYYWFFSSYLYVFERQPYATPMAVVVLKLLFLMQPALVLIQFILFLLGWQPELHKLHLDKKWPIG